MKKGIQWASDVKEAAVNAQPVEVHTTNNTGLNHLSNTCPGLTGAGSRLHVEPCTFQTLFSLPKPLIIPLLQRKYCWEEDQLRRWWRDAVSSDSKTLGSSQGHGTGKCVFKSVGKSEASPRLLCLDGQQRCSSQLILLTSLRDALFPFFECESIPLAEIEILLSRIERLVYQDVERFTSWVKDWLKSVVMPVVMDSTVSLDDKCSRVSKLWTGLFDEGSEPPFEGGFKLLPSFSDRAPFFELLSTGRCSHEVRKMMIASEASDISLQLTTTIAEAISKAILEPSLRAKSSKQGLAKCLFDAAIHRAFKNAVDLEELKAQQKFQHSSAHNSTVLPAQEAVTIHETKAKRVRFDKLKQMVSSAMRMSLMYCEVLSEINLSQTFLWLQEKELFGMGSLLYNPNPGIPFCACDLVRNMLLSTTMHLEMEEQEVFYRQMWLEAIELRVGGPAAVDRILHEFLQHEWGQRATSQDSIAATSVSKTDISRSCGRRQVADASSGTSDEGSGDWSKYLKTSPEPDPVANMPQPIQPLNGLQSYATDARVSVDDDNKGDNCDNCDDDDDDYGEETTARAVRAMISRKKSARQAQRHISSFERKVKQVKDLLPAPFADKAGDSSAIALYARFVSRAEQLQLDIDNGAIGSRRAFETVEALSTNAVGGEMQEPPLEPESDCIEGENGGQHGVDPAAAATEAATVTPVLPMHPPSGKSPSAGAAVSASTAVPVGGSLLAEDRPPVEVSEAAARELLTRLRLFIERRALSA